MTKSVDIALAPFIKVIRSKVDYTPDLAVICGSGLSNLASLMTETITIQYHELGANFPHSAVEGHVNELVFGKLGNKSIMAFRGRFHYYEGWTTQQSTLGVRLAAALGVKAIIVTNAAGGLSPEYQVGDLMMIEGQINLLGMTGSNPLMGPNNNAEGPRFPPISCFDEKLMAQFRAEYEKLAAEKNHDHELRQGCYVGLSGPNYESAHEVQMLRTIGGNSVGMSTVNECLVASHLGLSVLGLSLITNSGIGTTPEDKAKPIPDHSEVIAETKKVEPFIQSLIAQFIGNVDLSHLQPAKMSALYTPEALAAAPAIEQKNGEMVCPVSGQTMNAKSGGLGCPFAKTEGPKCPFHCPVIVSGIIGGLIGATIAAIGLVTYAHAPLFNNKE